METKKKFESNKENTDNLSSRRNFLKKGTLVTAPVILSAWSRPVMAATVSLSGILSGNQSGEGYREGGYGKSPGYWHKESRYNGTGVDPNAGYHTIFPGTYHISDSNTGESYTLLEIIDMFRSNGTADDKWSPGAHLIAAYMNTIKYSDYLLTEQDVFDLATEYANNPSHEKSGMIREFLDTTWT